jgi:hypothetical protein
LLHINPLLFAIRTFIVASSSLGARLQKTGIRRVPEQVREKSARQDASGATLWLRLISYPSLFCLRSGPGRRHAQAVATGSFVFSTTVTHDQA